MSFQLFLISVTTRSSLIKRGRRRAAAGVEAGAEVANQNHDDHQFFSTNRRRSSNSSSISSSLVSQLLSCRLFILIATILLATSPAAHVKADGPNCMQNGMGPKNLYMNGVMNPDYMWSRDGSTIYVPVVMDESYTPNQLKRITGGFHEIEEKTCVKFHYLNNHTVGNQDHVYVTKQKQGCWSYIGRIGGKQEISLPRGCMSHRTAVHEMIHALGFAHEHVRADRDNYIHVNWGNIEQGRERNFVKRKTKSSDPFGPYDYGSIMHYDRKAFSDNGEDTIVPKQENVRIGLDTRMSSWDTQKINRMYKCGSIFGGSNHGYDDGGGGFGFANTNNEIDNNFLGDDIINEHQGHHHHPGLHHNNENRAQHRDRHHNSHDISDGPRNNNNQNRNNNNNNGFIDDFEFNPNINFDDSGFFPLSGATTTERNRHNNFNNPLFEPPANNHVSFTQDGGGGGSDYDDNDDDGRGESANLVQDSSRNSNRNHNNYDDGNRNSNNNYEHEPPRRNNYNSNNNNGGGGGGGGNLHSSPFHDGGRDQQQDIFDSPNFFQCFPFCFKK